MTEFYKYKKLNKTTSYCKLCNLKDIHARSLAIKEACVAYLGGKCVDCGYCGHSCAYDFHHRDPAQKDFAISKHKSKKLTKQVCEELDKCDLLCAICHRLRHFKQEYVDE